YVWDLWEWIMRQVRVVMARLRALCPVVSLPLWHCGEGWSGEWLLDGHVESRCLCGCVITGDVLNGQLKEPVYSTKLCRHYWMGTVPVNMLGYGETSPLLASDTPKVVPFGTSGWAEVVVTTTHVVIRRTSAYKLLRQQILSAAVAEPYYVDGIPVSWDADARAPAMVYGPGQSVTIDGERYTLPHQLRLRNVAPSEVSSEVSIDIGTETEDSELTEADLPPAAAALQAIENAARILEPHIDVIMEDCSTPSLCGSSREMPVWGEDIPRTPSPALISVTESSSDEKTPSVSSSQEDTPSSDSFEVIQESETAEGEESVFNVALSVLKALFPQSDATRKLTVKMSCCVEKSVTRFFSLGLTVADVASLCEMEIQNHTAYCDQVRTPLELQVGCLVGNELTFECDKCEARQETLA
nr:putative NS5A protein [GB virus C]